MAKEKNKKKKKVHVKTRRQGGKEEKESIQTCDLSTGQIWFSRVEIYGCPDEFEIEGSDHPCLIVSPGASTLPSPLFARPQPLLLLLSSVL